MMTVAVPPAGTGGAAVNEITLTGAVATDPQPRPGLEDPAVVFRLLVPRDDPDAEPLYVDVVSTGDLALFCACLEFGDHVAVAGSLDHHEWTGDDGLHRSRWVVVAKELVVLRAAEQAA
jgi:single-stranded DNA-binding protein